MKGFAVLAVMTMIPAALAAQAPRDTAQLSEIVVTATRLPAARSSVPATVTVIEGSALRAQGIQYVADALRAAPGATVVQNGSFGAATSLFLRGGESDYVQVLVDGVQVNGSGGTYDLGSLTTDNLDRIEIVAGPASVLYGSDAVAGVVQIFTRRGRGGPAVETGVQAGSRDALSVDAGFRGGDERLDYAFALSRFSTSGTYAFNSQHRNTVGSGRVRIAPDHRTDATLTLRHGDATFHYPTDGSGRLVDQNQFTSSEGTTFGLDAGRYFTDHVEGRILLAAHEQESGSEDRPDGPADTLGFYGSESLTHATRRSIDARANVHLGPRAVATVGGQVSFQAARSFSQFSSQFGPSSGQSRFDRTNRGYYAQAVLEPIPGTSLTLGGRLDDNETFGSFATYRVGGSFRLPGGARLRASVGTGFKEPTFEENFDTGFSNGNADLKPERSQSWEIGVEESLGNATVLSATWFSQRFRDLIQYTFDTPSPTSPNYFNVAAANASGVELGARTWLFRLLTLEASYAWLRTEVTNAGFDTGPDATFVNGESLLRRPASSAAVRGTFAVPGRGSVSAAVRYVGERDDRDFASFPAPRVTLPAYTVVDFSGEIQLLSRPGLALTARVENALDRRYVEIVNFPARGRTIMAGGRVQLGGN